MTVASGLEKSKQMKWCQRSKPNKLQVCMRAGRPPQADVPAVEKNIIAHRSARNKLGLGMSLLARP